MTRRLPGQKEDEDEETYLARIEQRVQERLKKEFEGIPERFSELSGRSTRTIEHPIYRTTANDFGSMDMSEYERPTCYRTVPRQFTEKQHLGLNFEGSGMNL